MTRFENRAQGKSRPDTGPSTDIQVETRAQGKSSGAAAHSALV